MSTRKPDSFKAFERAFEWFLIGGAVLLLIALSFAYFGIRSLHMVPDEVREFTQSIIGNLIPTILIFVLAYVLLYRQIQRLRSEQEAERLAGRIAEIVGAEVRKIGESSRMVERSGRKPLLLTDLDWLYEGNDILRVEAEILTEVWIVSPHLLNDTGMQYEGTLDGLSTVQIAQENLRKNVRYTFATCAVGCVTLTWRMRQRRTPTSEC